MITISDVTRRFLDAAWDRAIRHAQDEWLPHFARLTQGEVALLKLEMTALVNPAPPTNAPTALAKFTAPDWEYMTLTTTPTNEAPAVRRLKIAGGYLYQVAYQDNTGKWHPPTFVPSLPAGQFDLSHLASTGTVG